MHVLTADYRARNAPEIFVESLHKTGFAVITHHPIRVDFIDEVYAEWRDFFASEIKQQYIYNKETIDGYFPFRSENAKYTAIKDLKEFYNYYPWGKFPNILSNKTNELYNQLSDLAGTLLQWLDDLTPPHIKKYYSMTLPEMIKDSPRTMLRIINYPPLTGDEHAGEVRSAEHEDINLLTLLPAATATGLQLKDKQNRWRDIVADTGTIVINVGDMLQMCSQHYFQSTTHRVINPEGPAAKQQRLSMPLFVHPHDEVRLSDSQTAKTFWLERMREIGLM
jgi:isopenicillin N synthase-like dioxygenase